MTIRLGYVGCGGLAQLVHIPNIAALAQAGRCRLEAIAEVRPRLAQLVASRWQVPRVHRDHHALAADPAIDAVVVSGHWATQGDIAADLLAAGKHVLVEKPLAATVAQAERILRVAQASGRHLMVAHMKRFDAGNVLFKRTVDRLRAQGEMGRLRYVRSQGILGDWMAGLEHQVLTTEEPYPPVHEHWPEWLPVAHRNQYYGFLQQYVHQINFLRWLLDAGPGELGVRAVALDPADGYTGVTLLEARGCTITLESGSMRCHEWNEKTSCFFEGGMVESRMFTLLLKHVPSTVEIYQRSAGGGATRTELFPDDGRTWAYRTEIEHFLAVLEGSVPLRAPGSDALEDTRVLEAIYRQHVEALPATRAA